MNTLVPENTSLMYYFGWNALSASNYEETSDNSKKMSILLKGGGDGEEDDCILQKC